MSYLVLARHVAQASVKDSAAPAQCAQHRAEQLSQSAVTECEQSLVSAVRVAMETVSQLRLVKDLTALRLEGNKNPVSILFR